MKKTITEIIVACEVCLITNYDKHRLEEDHRSQPEKVTSGS